ncbi:MAG: prepilin-type N-terminal cleavage/methylation domain-containing protein [Candidatus Moraniibacteriota bacterium]
MLILTKFKYTKKAGMTLVEMLIAMFIFLIGIAGLTMLASKSWGMNSFVIESGNATSKATSALNSVIKNLRKIRQADDGSYPVKEVGSNSLTVYLDDDNTGDGKVERVRYYLDSATQTLKKGVTKSSGTPAFYPAAETISVVANYVVNTPAQPVFEYYNSDYPIDTINNPLVNPAVADVKLVKVRLWVNIKPLTAPDNVNLESFVEFRNLNDNY